jgi:hypothetical protein
MRVSTFERICQELNADHVRYLVAGGIAVNAHGYVRLTEDIDLIIWLDPENILRAFTALKRAGYQPQQPIHAEDFANPSIRESWRRDKQMVVLKMCSDADPSTPVDVFVYEPFDFKIEFARAKLEDVRPGLTVPVVGLGALLRMKEAAARPKDQIDIQHLRDLHGL